MESLGMRFREKMREGKMQKKGQQEGGQRKDRTAFCSCCLSLGDLCGFRNPGRINFAVHAIWGALLAHEAGEEAGGSWDPAFPAGPCLELALGMGDKRGVTQTACPLNQARVTGWFINSHLLSNLLIKAERIRTCVSSSLCRKITSLTFSSQKNLKIHIFPRVGMWKWNFILQRRCRELHVPGTSKDALSSSGGWGPGGSKCRVTRSIFCERWRSCGAGQSSARQGWASQEHAPTSTRAGKTALGTASINFLFLEASDRRRERGREGKGEGGRWKCEP